jgi:hypothetical protein
MALDSTRRAAGSCRCDASENGPPTPDTTPLYCTFAVTVAVAFSVNVHVLVLFPPLEHPPDQTASRPFDTARVIDAPAVKLAEPVLPTSTLMPAGVEVMRSPLLPVADTVNIAVPVGATGFRVTVAVVVTPP